MAENISNQTQEVNESVDVINDVNKKTQENQNAVDNLNLITNEISQMSKIILEEVNKRKF